MRPIARFAARAVILLLLLPAACSPADLLNSTIATGGLTVTRDVAYAPGPRHTLDIWRPTGAAGLPLIVFLYGGSWRTGSKSIYTFVAATLARRGAVVVVPDYRLYPEVQFPTFLEDNAAATAFAAAHATEWGGDGRRVFLLGHSAGAYDAAMLALDPRYLAAAGYSRAKLAGVIALAGPYDFLPITDPDIIPVFAPVADGPASQPITYVDGHNPPMLLLAGEADQTVNPHNTRALAARIMQAGGAVQTKFYKGLGHIGIISSIAPLLSGQAPVADDIWHFVAQTPAPIGERPGPEPH